MSIMNEWLMIATIMFPSGGVTYEATMAEVTTELSCYTFKEKMEKKYEEYPDIRFTCLRDKEMSL